MSKNRKLLGPLEAINGVLMLGMSAAALMVILQQLVKLQYGEDLQAADDEGPQRGEMKPQQPPSGRPR
jgi:hypothetical protein